MSAFEYTALDKKGREKKGIIEGDSARLVRQQLREQSLVPLTVIEVKKKATNEKNNNFFFKPKNKHHRTSFNDETISNLSAFRHPIR